MKSVVKYRDRCKTIFCANCKGRVMEVPIKQAEEIARSGSPVHCDECVAVAAEMLDVDRTIEGKLSALAELQQLAEDAVMKDVALDRAKRELLQGQLAQIAEHRLYEYRGSAGMN